MVDKPSQREDVQTAGFPGKQPSKVTSESLLGSGRQLVILHNGREYVLRLTQSGKLILTA